MSSVEICVDPDRDLTRVKINGILSTADFTAALTDERFGKTSLILWDLREASFSEMTREKLHEIANIVKDLETRSGWAGKATATVANNRDGLLMARLYFEIAQYVVGQHTNGLSTTSMQEAEDWLADMLPLAKRSVG